MRRAMAFPLPPILDEFRRRIPTTDLYVLNPLRHLARHESELPRVAHLFGHVYAVGRTCVVSRIAGADELRRLDGRRFRQIVYVVDDDFEAGAEDPLLPARYRARLAAFAAGPLRELRERADVVVASSPALAALYGPKALVMQPAWRRTPAPLSHFERSGAFEIAHLGTASHAADLAPLGPGLARVLVAHPAARLTIFAAAACPPELREHPRVRLRGAMGWWRYKFMLPLQRFHLALYPLQDSRFTAARSANKLFEHALVGAASLMSPNPALRAATAAGDLADLFVAGGAEAWEERIRADLSDRRACRDRAQRTRAHILAADPLGAAARQWRAILTIPGATA